MIKLRDLVEYRNKNELNPKVFDGDSIKKKLRDVLLKVAERFYKELDIKAPIEDIILTGSSANYNWTPTSDIDIHLVVDFSKFKDAEMARNYFNAAKDLFGDKYDLKYGSNPVEVYVEDKNDERPHIMGIYSIQDDKWVKKPSKEKIEISDKEIKSKAEPIAASIEKVDPTKSGSVAKLDKLKDKINQLRQSGLDKDGEYSIENLAFKHLRNTGYLEKLANKKIEARKIEMAGDLLKEFVTPQHIQTLDINLDKKYSDIPLDIHFSKHFADQVNLLRNKKPITPPELQALFDKIYSKYGTQFKDLSIDAQGILRDLSTNINVPFYIAINPKSNKLNLIPSKRLVAATVMRKPEFKPNNPKDVVYPVNESLLKNKK
jgi:predicted nucleotidyltransferase